MKFLVLFPAILLIGCASTAKNMDLVSVGMTKQAVIYILGEPAETRASEDVEYMFYRLRCRGSHPWPGVSVERLPVFQP
jgi:hypothetical protein